MINGGFYMKRTFSLLLMLCLTVSVCLSFASCGDQSDIPTDLKYSGEKITFLTCGVNPTYESEILPNNYEEETGLKKELPESLNADLQKRRDIVVSTLGVDFEEVKIYEQNRPKNKMYETIVNAQASGAVSYDVVVPCIYDAAILAQESLFYNLNKIPELDIKAEWWNQEFNEQMTFNGQLYFTIGELGHLNKNNSAALYFNLDLWKTQNLSEEFGGTPYDLVRQGKWTLDLVIEATRSVPSEDLNGDGVIKFNDKYGWAGQDDDLWSLFYGAGERIAKIGDGQEPYISMYNTRSNRLMTMIQDLTQDDDYYIRANDYFGQTSTEWPTEELQKDFATGKCLFFNDVVGGIISISKDMEAHFGVVPEPKYEAKQETYHSLINPWNATCYAIPSYVRADRLPMIAEVLDLMGKTSLETTSVSYADILNYMKTRDDDSKDMLNEYILPNRACDIGMVYRWGDLQNFLQQMGQNAKGTFGSQFQRLKSKANQDLKMTLDFFKANA